MHSHLAQAEPLKIAASRAVPDPNLLAKFELLRQFLLLVLKDWQREAEPRQRAIDSAATAGAITHEEASAFLELQPVFLKCLFSYAFFFVAAESAYSAVYETLEDAARAVTLPHPIPPRPMTPQLAQRLRHVRNWSIAHVASPRTRRANREAVTMWQPLTWSRPLGGRWHLDNLAFGGFRVVVRDLVGNIVDQSDEFELPGLMQLHQVCDNYLEQYDQACLNALETIRPYSLHSRTLGGA